MKYFHFQTMLTTVRGFQCQLTLLWLQLRITNADQKRDTDIALSRSHADSRCSEPNSSQFRIHATRLSMQLPPTDQKPHSKIRSICLKEQMLTIPGDVSWTLPRCPHSLVFATTQIFHVFIGKKEGIPAHRVVAKNKWNHVLKTWWCCWPGGLTF